MSELRQQPAAQAGPFWRVHGLQQLSEVQIRQAENHWRSVSQLFGRRSGRAPLKEGQDILRLQPLPGLRFRSVGQTAAGEVSRVRLQLYDRKVAQGRTGGAVSERRVQIQTTD